MQRLILVLLMLGMLSFPQAVLANGLPVNAWWPSANFVPNGETKVGVVSEELTFSFPETDYPRVTAHYVLENRSSQDERLTIAFLYLQTTAEMTATWNGQPLSIQPFERPTPPSDWQPPERFPDLINWETHWLDPATGAAYAVKQVSRQGSSAVLFPISIPAGAKGDLVVSFIQGMTGCDKCKSRRMLQHYTYLLSPARYWAFFEHLTVRVEAPANRQIVTEPKLAAEPSSAGKQVFVGQFDNLPQGELHLSTRRRSQVGDYMPWVGAALLVTSALVIWRRRRA